MGSEFWAAIAGAVVGAVISGVITVAMQFVAVGAARKERVEEREERLRSLAHSLLIKAGRLYGSLDILHAALQEGLNEQLEGRPWQKVQAVGNLPDPIHFTTEELALVASNNWLEAFQLLVAVEEGHKTVVGLWRDYGAYRDGLLELMPPPEEMTGLRGAPSVTREQLIQYGPRMAVLDHMVETLGLDSEINLTNAARLLDLLNPALKKRFKLSFVILPKNRATDAKQA
jgi:hypothetical protein